MTCTIAKKAPLPILNSDLIRVFNFHALFSFFHDSSVTRIKLLFYTVINIKVTLLKITVNKNLLLLLAQLTRQPEIMETTFRSRFRLRF